MTKKDENEIMEIESLREPMSIGKVFAESDMFPDIKSQAQAVVKIIAGRELGLSAFQSMKDIYIVNGKLAIQSNALASLIKSSTKYDYRVDVLNDTECKITMLRIKGDGMEEIGVSEFTFKDAAKAGLVNKDNWKNFPRNMLFARALANGQRWYAPDIACGWHVSEEYEDMLPTNRTGTVTIEADGTVVKGESNGEEA